MGEETLAVKQEQRAQLSQATYTIKEAAERTGISEDTIRFYERIGLLPRAERRPNGHRIYREDTLEMLRIIACFRKTGLPLESMKPFLQLKRDEDLTAYPELVALAEAHKRHIERQIASLQQIVGFLDAKLRPGQAAEDLENCTLADPVKRPPSAQASIR